MAWWPATHGETGPARSGGRLTARVPRACSGRRGGASAGGSPVDAARQGARLQHHRYEVATPRKESVGGTHRGGRATVGWRGATGAAAFQWRAALAGWRRPRGRSCG
jgi:hypothetical protein